MPEGRFSEAETRRQTQRIYDSIAAKQQEFDRDELRLVQALHLIKVHIGPEQTAQNEDLHNAVQLIVEFARKHDHLIR